MTLIRAHYAILRRKYGAQHWWPGRSRFEVIVGAFLTQNTAWTNVERALRSLRRAGVLSLRGIRETPETALAELIRSSGFYRQKAHSLKVFVEFLDREHGGSLNRMFSPTTKARGEELREQLLRLKGAGPETADSILLYAGNFPSFVVDAYSRRVFSRHLIFPAKNSYDEIRRAVETALASRGGHALADQGFGNRPSPASKARGADDAQHFNEFHALLVEVGKRHCHKTSPDCEHCPLRKFLPMAAKRGEKSGERMG